MSVAIEPKISFGILVLNGEPFLQYCLRALYPYAHQILVVEGAVQNAKAISTPSGHSLDSTLDSLSTFKEHEDPDGKIKVITRDSGFWRDKIEMGKALNEEITGEYFWQVDTDEFYLESDLKKIISMLAADPSIDGCSFRWKVFWGDEKTEVDGWHLKRYQLGFNRLFRWKPESDYDHYGTDPKGPTVEFPNGLLATQGNWVTANDPRLKGIFLYHFSLLFESQVLTKTKGYADGVAIGPDNSKMHEWALDNWVRLGNPFRVHNRYQEISWLKSYNGPLPDQVRIMMNNIRDGSLDWQLREMSDVRTLLKSWKYKVKSLVLEVVGLGHVQSWWFKVDGAIVILAENWVNLGSKKLFRSICKKILRGGRALS